jgi:hypothetical protein
VRLRFDAAPRIGAHRPQARRRAIARLGIAAFLFQAMLFAWHAHALPYASSDASSIAGAPRTGDRTSTTIDLDCQICFAFCHYSAAPVDFIFSVPPDYESFS